MTTTAVRYGNLSPIARQTMTWWGTPLTDGEPRLTIAGYIRRHFPDGVWGGDTCGCSDDRCRGYHHSERDEDCGCLPVLWAEYEASVVDA